MPPALPPPSSPLLRIATGSGHAGVKGKYGRADRLAGKATLTSGLLLGRPEVLRNLRHSLGAKSQGHHTIDRLEERGVERGSARRSSLKGRETTIVSQTNTGTVSKATLGKLLRLGGAHVRFPKRIDTILNSTERNATDWIASIIFSDEPKRCYRGHTIGRFRRAVNSLGFCRASLKSLGCFYFRCVLS